jgi:hypothetical protein
MNSWRSQARHKPPGISLLAKICVVCYATALAQTSGMTESATRQDSSSGLRASTPSHADAVEPNSTNQRLDEVEGSFARDDSFMGAVLVAKGSEILSTIGDLQNRRAAGHPVAAGFDPHSLRALGSRSLLSAVAWS